MVSLPSKKRKVRKDEGREMPHTALTYGSHTIIGKYAKLLFFLYAIISLT